MVLSGAALLVVFWLGHGEAIGAELERETARAYEQHIARLQQEFASQTADQRTWLDELPPEAMVRLRQGEILARPGSGDGIVKVPGGLIHHWRAAAFVPETTLGSVLAVAKDYDSYAATYDWVIRSSLLGHVSEPERNRDLFRAAMRVQRKARFITSTIDIWTTVEYRYPKPGRAIVTSNADCIRQVEDAGEADERRLTVGKGNGYLWRANTYATYVEGEGGVYIDLQTLGLSRGFPRLLGWMIEPIAKRLGRGSAATGLEQLRRAIVSPAAAASGPTPERTAGLPLTVWCGA